MSDSTPSPKKIWNPTVVSIEGLYVTRSGKRVLENIDLEIAKGEFVGIVGPNGGGKTTLLMTILGILNSTKGKIEVFGVNPYPTNFRGEVGWVSQTAANIPTKMRMTVRELIYMGTVSRIELFPSRSKKKRERIEKAMELTGISHLADKDIARLSGGERQRAVIGRALASDAEVLIFDEPLVNVDRNARNGILKLLDTLCHEQEKTLLLVSHDMAAIRQSAHRVVYLDGSIQYDGHPDYLPDLIDLAGLRGIKHVHQTDDQEEE
ncbi:ABC transporter ATP-binding protein [Candidatus Poseidoniaceae archaeon]|nr:ABC transporter ATP-binding protein [Candidatus Poseidoniaceae archaeon]